jgi:hypothetical protein
LHGFLQGLHQFAGAGELAGDILARAAGEDAHHVNGRRHCHHAEDHHHGVLHRHDDDETNQCNEVAADARDDEVEHHARTGRAGVHAVEEFCRVAFGEKRDALREQRVVNLALIVGDDAIADLRQRDHLAVGRSALEREKSREGAAQDPDHLIIAVDEDAVDNMLHHVGGECGGRGDNAHKDERQRVAPGVLAAVGGEEARDDFTSIFAEQRGPALSC